MLGLLVLFASAQPVELSEAEIKEVIMDYDEFLSYGDDGRDCDVTLENLVRLSASENEILVKFDAFRDYRQHGCYPYSYSCQSKLQKSAESSWMATTTCL